MTPRVSGGGQDTDEDPNAPPWWDEAEAFVVLHREVGVRASELADDTLADLGIALTVFPAIGAADWLIAAVTCRARLGGHVVVIATVSGAILATVAVVVTVVATYTAYRSSADPDDVVIPVVTNVADVLGVVILLGVVQVVLGLLEL